MKRMTGFRAGCAGLFAAMVLTLAACGGGGGGGGGGGAVFAPIAPATPTTPAPAPVTSAARVETLSITSTFNATSYPIEVYLPAGYDNTSGALPAVYILDGDSVLNLNQSRFANFRGVLEAKQKKAILVGIGNTKNRNID